MIKRRPSIAEINVVLSYRLAFAVTKDYERILIGPEKGIFQQLSGQNNTDVMYDQSRPFGTFLLRTNPIPHMSWESAISSLFQAQRILHSRI